MVSRIKATSEPKSIAPAAVKRAETKARAQFRKLHGIEGDAFKGDLSKTISRDELMKSINDGSGKKSILKTIKSKAKTVWNFTQTKSKEAWNFVKKHKVWTAVTVGVLAVGAIVAAMLKNNNKTEEVI